MKKIRVLLLLLLFVRIGYAQDTSKVLQTDDLLELSLEELLNTSITVASTKVETIFTSVSTVSIVDRDMIERYNFRTIAEALQIVSNIDIVRTYLKRDIPTSRGILQDNYANKVLIMINNVPLWNAVTGEGSIDRVNIDNVEKIEVLKGPASVMYGTNAYSGAINIVLKKDINQIYVNAGEMDLINGGAQVGISKNEISANVAINYGYETGDEYTFTDEKKQTSSIREYLYNKNATTNLSYKNHSVMANVYESDESYMGVTPKFSEGAGNNHLNQGFMSSYLYKAKIMNKIDINFMGIYDKNRRDLSRTMDDKVRANVIGDRLSGILNLTIPLLKNLNLDLGGNYDYKHSFKYDNYYVPNDSLIENNYMKNLEQWEYSTLGQINYTLKWLKLVAGGRYTQNQVFGDNISKRATMVFPINPKNSIKVIYGESFRAPSLFEQFFETSTGTVKGNVNLKPETSQSIEIGYLTSYKNIFAQILFYQSNYLDKIYRDQDTTITGTKKKIFSIYKNGNKFTARGIELELKYHNSKIINVFANYNYCMGDDGDNDGSGNYNFKYIPEHSVAAGLSRDIKKITLSSVFNYKSATNGPFTKINEGFLFDFNIGYKHKVGKNILKHFISVKNAFDNNYYIAEYVRRISLNEVPYGYGRRIMYSIKYEF